MLWKNMCIQMHFFLVFRTFFMFEQPSVSMSSDLATLVLIIFTSMEAVCYGSCGH